METASLATKIAKQAGDLRIAQDTAFPWGAEMGAQGPKRALKKSPDVIFGQHDQPTLKL